VQPLKIALIFFSTLLLCIPGVTSKAGYVIFSDILSSSGGEVKGDSYLLGATIGQTVIGRSSSASYSETAGFWNWGMLAWRPSGIRDGAHPELSLPKEYSLSQNFPNPFNPVTSINYSLPKATNVKLEIYNVLGQWVRTLVDEPQSAGYKTVRWNGRDGYGRELSSGVYFYRLEAGKYSSSRKLLLLK